MAQEIPGAHVVGDFGQKALILKDGKVLVCRGIGDTDWDLPGGRLHVGEDPQDGLKRELKEELGAEVEVGEPFFVTVWYGAKSGLPRIFVVYIATLIDPSVALTVAKDELEEVAWIGKQEVEAFPLAPEWKQALRKFYGRE